MPSMHSLSHSVLFCLVARRRPLDAARTGAECRTNAEVLDLRRMEL